VSLIERKPLSIGRAERTRRDDRFFVVAAEDTYAPDQYFKGLEFPRVKVVLLPTPKDSGLWIGANHRHRGSSDDKGEVRAKRD
jgi:hypothetical protein